MGTAVSTASSAEATTFPTLPVESARCIFCPDAPSTTLTVGRDYEYDTCPETFAMRRCDGCGLVFVSPRPTASAMGTIYPSNYYAYNEGSTERPFVKRFRDGVEHGKIARWVRLVGRDRAAVIDVGAGDGRLLDVMRKVVPAGWSLSGIELGAGAAQRAAAKGFTIRTGDVESLDLRDWHDRFDLVLLHHVIEHTRDPRATIRTLRTLMRPGGVISIETPEPEGWDVRLFGRYWGGWHIPRHFYLFDRLTLARLLTEEGFVVISTRSILSPAFWVHSMHNWLVDRPWGQRLAAMWHPQNIVAIALATAVDLVQLRLRRRTTNLQILARVAA